MPKKLFVKGQSGNPTGGIKHKLPMKRSVNEAIAAAATGIMPRDFLLQQLRDETVELYTRIKVAIELMPYYHPRLATIEHTGEQKVIYHIADKPMTMDEWAAKWAGVDTTTGPTNVIN